MNLDPETVTSFARLFGTDATRHGLALAARDVVDVHEVVSLGGSLVEVAAAVDDSTVTDVRLRMDRRDGGLLGFVCGHHGDEGCGHVLAALLAAGRSALAAPEERLAPWQRALEAVVPTTAPTRAGEAAVFVSVVDPRATRDVWSYGRRRSPFLGVRPAVRGVRGAWIKGNTSWPAIEDLPADPDAVRLLTELARLYEIGGGHSAYYAAPEWYALDAFAARGLWEVLSELRDAGVELVSPGRAQHPVALDPTPARARVSAEQHRGRLRVRAQLLLGEEPTDVADLYAVGDPAVAVARVAHPGEAAEQVTLHPLEAPVEQALWLLLRGRDTISVDAEGRERFEADYLPRLRALAPVESPDGSYAVPPPAALALALTVGTSGADGADVEIGWDWTGVPPGTRRDRPREAAILRAVRDAVGDHAGPATTAPGAGTAPPPGRTLARTDGVVFLAEVVPRLREIDGVEVREADDVPRYRMAAAEPVVSIAAQPQGNDWFDLHVEVSLDGEMVEFAQVFVALAAGDPIFVLPDGRYFSLEGPELDQLRGILEEARALSDRPVDELRISRYQVDLWAELVELGVVAAQEQVWLTSARGLTEAASLEPVEAPAGLRADLRGYQLQGLAWLHFLRTHRLGGILGDDMGLGKTLQAIAMMALAFESEPGAPPFLVVAPTSVVGNWVRECERFAPGLRVVGIDATERRRGAPLATAIGGAHVVVTSYTLLRLEEDGYRAQPWSGLILDEAQMVKNHRSRGYRSARMVEAPFKLAITGTPLENNLQELWALSSLVCPGLLGGELHFREHYRDPIEKDCDGDRLARLQRRLRPFLLRRRKADVATELPPKQEQVLELELHPKHRRLYELRLQRERQKVLGLLDDVDSHRFQVFRSLTLLRQLALDAALVDDADEAPPPSAKLEALDELLAEAAAEGHRVLVFSQFTRFLAKARDRAEAAGIPTAYLDGSTRRRDAEIERFRRGEVPAFFVSLKAGGFGLNLTEADYVVLLDPWWNPATEAQAVDRTHRIGQTRTVMVYRLVAARTIEAKVRELSARKAQLFSDVLDGDGTAGLGALTADEIRDLVS